MNLHALFFALCATVTLNSFSQTSYPKDFFRSPLDIPLQLSGNFGELRSNHFHAGFDFRTQQKEGLNVYAAADGYVSRIKISAYGYGKAIYIDHPNGYTTVYGHLLQGASKVENYIKQQHYKEQNFEIDVFPQPGELVVTKGELIALSGNTGGSQGPHLHFEIRDTASEKVINPLHFGFDIIIIDTKKPVVTDLLVYPIDGNSTVNQSKAPMSLSLSPQADGTYLATKVSASGKIGFGFGAYDSNNFSSNRNGIYKVESFVNGNFDFGYQFDSYAFSESRYINALIDYARFKRNGQRIQKLFMKRPFPLSIMRAGENNGIIDVVPNLQQVYRLEVSDYHNNKSVISVPIEFSASSAALPTEMKSNAYFVKSDKDYNFEKDNITVFIPANTFYEDLYLDFDVNDSVLMLGNSGIPVHTNFTITFKNPDGALTDEKTFIGSISGSRMNYNSTRRKGNEYTTYTKNLGKFVLTKDSIAPRVAAVKNIEGKWLSTSNTMEFKISDNLSGIKEFHGYLNGKWILFEYDYKTAKITHDFRDGVVVDGRNELKIVVSDNVGNSTIFETHFFRSQK